MNNVLENALIQVSEREDEKQATNAIARKVLEYGVENLGKCLSVLTPKQIMALTKRLIRNMTYESYAANEHADNTEIEPEAASDEAERVESELEAAYMGLNVAYLKAEKIVLGWKAGYALQGLPYYSSQRENGVWDDIFDLGDARRRIASDKDARRAAEANDNRESLSALSALSF